MRLSVLAVSMMLASCGARTTAVATGGDATAGGQHLYAFGCGSCHTIPGIIGAHGRVGPSLEGVGGRNYIAGQLANQPSNLERWIQHPHAIHPDTLMPELGLTETQSRDIAA